MHSSKSPTGVFAVILGAMLMVATLAFAQADPFVGTWVLNVGKSQFQSGSAVLRSRTLVITPKGDAFSHVVETYRLGWDAVIRSANDSKYDGSDAPITGAAFTTVSFNRMGRTLSRTAKDGATEVETATYTLSADGKTMTIVTKGNNRGIEYASTQVFEKKS